MHYEGLVDGTVVWRHHSHTEAWQTWYRIHGPLPQDSGLHPASTLLRFLVKKKKEREKEDMVKATHRWRSVTFDRIYRIYISNIFKWLGKQYIRFTNYSSKMSTTKAMEIIHWIVSYLWKFIESIYY